MLVSPPAEAVAKKSLKLAAAALSAEFGKSEVVSGKKVAIE
jgi:hypothetical protein